MRTVPTLLASGTGIGLSAVGLVVVRTDQRDRPQRPSTADSNMTAVATYTTTTTLDPPGATSPFAFPRPRSRRQLLSSEREDGTPRPGSVRIDRKRRSPTPRAHSSTSMHQTLPEDEEIVLQHAASNTQSSGWLRRRLSRSMSTSRDSSRTPTSRPASAAVSHSNGSVAFPHIPSTIPTLVSRNATPSQPNKLVKRSSSVRSANGSPYPGSGSRLPLPVFRRPATSHQRSATWQSQLSAMERHDGNFEHSSLGARDPQWQHYFTPRITVDSSPFARRRSSTAIPNPIKRIYPDRKYTPTLVSANALIRTTGLELDDGFSEPAEDITTTRLSMPASVASSPVPVQDSRFYEESPGPRRAFSVGNLLSPASQSLWRRPTSRGSATASTKLSRRGRARVVSAPLSRAANHPSGDDEPPAKRRDLSDSQRSDRMWHSSSSATLSETPHDDEMSLDPVEDDRGTQYVPPQAMYTRPFPTDQQFVSVARNGRTSASHSEIASTIGSDSERRSMGDNSTDYQSDAAFDSILTRTTRSSSGRRGPHIENIFDDSSPSIPSSRSTKLRDFLSDGHVPDSDHNAIYRHSTIEEEGSVLSTPVRSMRSKSVTSTPSGRPGATPNFTSSPPPMNMFTEPEEIDWDAPDDELDRGLGIRDSHAVPSNGDAFDKAPPFRFGPVLRFSGALSVSATPNRNGTSPPDRTNLFDWSEQQPSPSHPNNSPPRPRTVHGKKDQDRRVSRAAGRRPTSGMHARSHSVPIVPDVDGKRNDVAVNKFGTWGVGSKAVTEDWNDDFEFDNPSPEGVDVSDPDGKRIDSGHEMFVPKLIREQQQNVVANIELLREWGLLIEELKELRVRAVALNIIQGRYAQAWREVDAMIELADQETEEETLDPQRSPPSSPGFDFNAFDEIAHDPTKSHDRRESPRKISGSAVPSPNGSPVAYRTTSQQNTPITTRPRKDSELVAQTVIAALQAKRNTDTNGLRPGTPSRKVPFDTATLRHIVPYVRGLTRRVKDALRETEGLHLTPRRRASPDTDRRTHTSNGGGRPSIRDILIITQDDDLPARRRARREAPATTTTDHDGNESYADEDRYLAQQMQKMTLPLSWNQ